MKPLRVFEAFAGIGSQARALEKLGIPYENVGMSEWERYSMRSYTAVHPKKDFKDYASKYTVADLENMIYDRGVSSDGIHPLTREQVSRLPLKEKQFIINHIKNYNNFVDVSRVNTADLPDMDLLTYSFPCQDLSVAGKGAGLAKGSGTRSGLLWECEKIIKEKRPKYLLLENVKQLIGVKFFNDFQKWLDTLESLGYKNFYKVLNARDYGMPQSRERVFVVSILDKNADYKFPEPTKLTKSLADYLQPTSEITENMFLKSEVMDRFMTNYDSTFDFYRTKIGTSHRDGGLGVHQRSYVYNMYGVCPTLTATMYKEPTKLLILSDTKHTEDYIDDREFHNIEKSTEKPLYNMTFEGPARSSYIPVNVELKDTVYGHLRKITPLECWRVMGFDDKDFENAKNAGMSDSRLYKQAGDSIVVNVLMAIFKEMFSDRVTKQ